jgi:hypothetical protein
MSRTPGCLLAACAWLAIAAIPRPAPAQELDGPEDAAPAQRPDEIDAAPDASTLERNFEQWIFGGRGAAETRKNLESALTRDIRRFDEKYGLTPAQKKKLELAGRLDVKRFFDRVEDARSEYRRAKGEAGWDPVAAGVFELQRIQNLPHAELFGDDSMLAKTLRKTLTPEQVGRHEKTVYRARVEWMAGLLDRRLNLDAEQHRRLVSLVVDETPPLKRYGSFDYDAIMLQVARLPREKLRAALDEAQCRELALRFEQARRMESILISEGYISAGKRPAAAAADRLKGPSERRGEKTVLTRFGRAGSD